MFVELTGDILPIENPGIAAIFETIAAGDAKLVLREAAVVEISRLDWNMLDKMFDDLARLKA